MIAIQHRTGSAPNVKQGFTLIELMATMVLIALLFSASIGVYSGMRRGEALRGAVSTVRGEVMAARDFAITQSRKTTMLINSNSMSAYYFYDDGGGPVPVVIRESIGEFVPPQIELTDLNGTPLRDVEIKFDPTGGAGSFSNVVFQIRERAGSGIFEMTVMALTGSCKVRIPEPAP